MMRRLGWLFSGLLVGSAITGCGGTSTNDAGQDAADSGNDMPEMGMGCGPFDPNVACNGPPGLYVPGSCTTLAAGVRYFEPSYQLWSDGATKERFILLPSGSATTIDVTDPDEWVFPVGTVFFKTFSLNGTRVETRILTKVGDGIDDRGADAWTYQAYAWNCEQTGVTYLGNMHTGVPNVLGTTHDIPSHAECMSCHATYTQDIALSFSAIQLNHGTNGGVLYPQYTLSTLNDADLLSPGDLSLTAAVIPENVGRIGVDRPALGYLHANCGNCHRGASAPGAGTPLRMWILVGTPDVQSTSTIVHARNLGAWIPPGQVNPLMRISPGQPLVSAIHYRLSRRNVIEMLPGVQMPPIATNIPNDAASTMIENWITSLSVLP